MPTINDPYFGKDSTVILTNPTKDDFTWKAGGRPYTLKAGATRGYVGYVADLCVKHFVDHLMNEASKTDGSVEKKMTNWLARDEYAKTIIVREDVVHDEEENEGAEVEADEGIDPDEVVVTDDAPATIEDVEKNTKTDEELYPEPKKSNIVEDEDVESEHKESSTKSSKAVK